MDKDHGRARTDLHVMNFYAVGRRELANLPRLDGISDCGFRISGIDLGLEILGLVLGIWYLLVTKNKVPRAMH